MKTVHIHFWNQSTNPHGSVTVPVISPAPKHISFPEPIKMELRLSFPYCDLKDNPEGTQLMAKLLSSPHLFFAFLRFFKLTQKLDKFRLTSDYPIAQDTESHIIVSDGNRRKEFTYEQLRQSDQILETMVDIPHFSHSAEINSIVKYDTIEIEIPAQKNIRVICFFEEIAGKKLLNYYKSDIERLEKQLSE